MVSLDSEISDQPQQFLVLRSFLVAVIWVVDFRRPETILQPPVPTEWAKLRGARSSGDECCPPTQQSEARLYLSRRARIVV